MGTRTKDVCPSLWNEGEGLQALSGAVIKDQYRYRLWRQWDAELPRVTFVLLNPSTADASHNDPTIRRCIDFAQQWGFGSLSVVNLFAYRSPSPRDLIRVADPIGPENDAYLSAAAAHSACLIAAWGSAGRYGGRDRVAMELLTAHHSHVFCHRFTLVQLIEELAAQVCGKGGKDV